MDLLRLASHVDVCRAYVDRRAANNSLGPLSPWLA